MPITSLVTLCYFLLPLGTACFALQRGNPLQESHVITSANVCLTNAECPKSHYCLLTGFRSTNRCTSRHLHAHVCLAYNDDCQSGLYCKFSRKKNGTICQKQISLQKPCSPNDVAPCVGSAICSRLKRKCLPPKTTGGEGDPCEREADCNLDHGVYCHYSSKTCKTQKSEGSKCDGFRDVYECNGFCAAGHYQKGGICLNPRPLGSLCMQDEHCAKVSRLPFPSARTVCNVLMGKIGRCMLQSALLKSLGLPCNPKIDRCDSRRALRCLFDKAMNKNVCQQRISVMLYAEQNRNYCTPGSPLSTCLQEDVARVCRRSKRLEYSLEDFFHCNEPIQTLPRGSVCDHLEAVQCEPGTSCEKLSGVRLRHDQKHQTPLLMCVKLVKRGGDCSDKFSTKCKGGLTCKKGTCIPDKPASISPKNTHTTIDGHCTSLPCIPGTVCDRPDSVPPSSGFKQCMFPVIVAKKGESCTDDARFRKKCISGLVCARDRKGRGLKVCRSPFKVGSICQKDMHCQGPLRCSAKSVDLHSFGKCYNTTTALPLGATCDPKAKVIAPQCVTTRTLIGFLHQQRELRCLSNGNGFVCQIAMTLFERCSADDNLACVGPGLVCGNLGLCIDRNFV